MLRCLVLLVVLLVVLLPSLAARGESVLAPTGTLRAAYIVSNLAQASRDPASGAFRGVAADLARELARQEGVPVTILPVETAARVLEAVRAGAADIGFIAPNPERTGVVLYSRPYMLVQQSALVRDGAPIGSVAELDRPGRRIGVNADDSVGVWLRGRLQHATLLTSPDYALKEAAAWLLDGTVDAFAGNRQRLAAGTAGVAGLHLLPDNLYGVPQTVAVAVDRPDRLARVQAIVDAWREAGGLAQAVQASGVDGIAVAD